MHLTHLFGLITTLTGCLCASCLKIIWLEGFVKLATLGASHTTETDVVVAHFFASEVITLRIIDFSVTYIAIKCVAVVNDRAT